jgi:tetratricopeptide (TPR) repeat protein
MKIEPLPTPHKWHLEAAQGWVGLGDYTEADEELEKIPPELRAHPDVLEVRLQIDFHAKKWEACVDGADAILKLGRKRRPEVWIQRSYALHELRRTAEARDGLLRVATRFRTNTTIFYNLACYESQLGNLEAAGGYLQKAIAISEPSEELRLQALNDPDLEPLWREHRINALGRVYALPVDLEGLCRRRPATRFFLALLFWAVVSVGVAWRDAAKTKVDLCYAGLAGAGLLFAVSFFALYVGLPLGMRHPIARFGVALLCASVVGAAVSFFCQL